MQSVGAIELGIFRLPSQFPTVRADHFGKSCTVICMTKKRSHISENSAIRRGSPFALSTSYSVVQKTLHPYQIFNGHMKTC